MNTAMMAKSQDVVVLLKWLCCPTAKSYAELASELGMSVGEVHSATQRAAQAGLFDLESKRPRMNALREYLIHGVKYAFPAHRGAPTRGMPTSYAAPPLRELIQHEEKVRGYALDPLFRNVPYAARKDRQLYELLALVDALREGRARERNLAATELGRRLEVLGNREVVPA